MSGFLDLWSLECVVVDSCQLYNSSMWGAHIAIALDFYPLFLMIGMYTISLYKYELYFAMVSICLTLGWIINFVIQRCFGETARFPDCGSPYQTPSFASQQIVTFEVLMTLYMLTWGHKLKLKLIILMRIFTFAVLVSRIFIGINTISQLLVGALLGFLLGIFYHIVIYFIIYPHFRRILEFTVLQWFGIVDTLCGSTKIVIRNNSLQDEKKYKYPEVAKAINQLVRALSRIPKKQRPKHITFELDKQKTVDLNIE